MDTRSAASVSYLVPCILARAVARLKGLELVSVQPYLRRFPPLGTIGGAGESRVVGFTYRFILRGIPTSHSPLLADQNFTQWVVVDEEGGYHQGRTELNEGRLTIILPDRVRVMTVLLWSTLDVHSWPVRDASSASGR